MDEFQELFKLSFNLTICPCTPWDPQFMSYDYSKLLTNLPAEIPPVNAFFIGREFLTWLWFKTEERGGTLSLSTSEEVTVSFVRQLTLVSGEGEYMEKIAVQGQHSNMREAKEAIRQGKNITECRIQLGRDNANWEFSIKGDRFHFSSINLPQTADEEPNDDNGDEDGIALERIYLIETAIQTMEQLFGLFLQVRLSKKWLTEEVENMKKWAFLERD